MRLREELAEIRRRKARGELRPKHAPGYGKAQRLGESEYIKNREGQRIERPQIYGLRWLRLFGEALVMQGIAARARVSTENWENTGCVRIHLQRVVHVERPAARISLVGGRRTLLNETARYAVGGGAWQSWPVPIGLVNSHDTRALVRLILTPQEADIVVTRNLPILAMHGR